MKRTFVAAVFLSALFAAQASAESSDFVLPVDEVASLSNIAFELAPVKSQQTLRAYQSITPEVLSPLGKLSASGRAEFLSSLTFNEKGLTGFNYRVLEDELTPSQAHSVLALFGAQRLTSRLKGARIETEVDSVVLGSQAKIFTPEGDYSGYRCVERASCMEARGYICMSNC
jgi:hypothetical protein